MGARARITAAWLLAPQLPCRPSNCEGMPRRRRRCFAHLTACHPTTSTYPSHSQPRIPSAAPSLHASVRRARPAVSPWRAYKCVLSSTLLSKTLQVDAVRRVLEAHFPRCPGTDVFQGDAQTPGRCGCRGEQHAYLLPEVGALLFCFNPDVYSKVCGSIGNPSYEILGPCVQAVEGTPLTLTLRAVNKIRRHNAVFGVRAITTCIRSLSLSHDWCTS